MMKPDHPTWLTIPSPNMWAGRKANWPVSGLVMHFTAAGSGKGSADYFSKSEVSWVENGVTKTAKVSAAAHLVVDRDGTTYQCVNFADRAWHAGPAQLWKGKPTPTNVNDFTIGIEIANWGQLKKMPDGSFVNYLNKPYKGATPFHRPDKGEFDYWEPYPEAQMNAVIQAAKIIIAQYPAITRDNVTGHENIQSNKVDPGPAFPWEHFLDSIYGDHEEHAALLNASEDDDRAGIYIDEKNEQCLDPNQAQSTEPVKT